MKGDAEYTSSYFTGMRVEVAIPLPHAQELRDWAVIGEVDEDLVSLQLLSDTLADGVRLRIGQILTIQSESGGQAHSCCAFIVSKGYGRDLLLRLTGEIVSEELREFYRIDAFLPMKFYLLHDQNPANVKREWEKRCKRRLEEERIHELKRSEARREQLRAAEHAQEQALEEGAASVGPDEADAAGRQKVEPENSPYHGSWGSVTSVAVNISAGGLKILTNQGFEKDEFLLLEIFVPSLACVVDIAARVVFSSRSDTAGDDGNAFNTGMQYVFIDERARFAVNSHISGVQLRRIRQFSGFNDAEPLNIDIMGIPDKHYAYTGEIDTHAATANLAKRKKRMQRAVLGLLFVCIAGLLCFYCSASPAKRPDRSGSGTWMQREK